VGAYFSGQCTSLGMLVRFAGDNVMMSPPLIITSDEIEEVNSFPTFRVFPQIISTEFLQTGKKKKLN
jgi:adenosylmethionine-8-amino-7-oxononanoate aminotransferase